MNGENEQTTKLTVGKDGESVCIILRRCLEYAITYLGSAAADGLAPFEACR